MARTIFARGLVVEESGDEAATRLLVRIVKSNDPDHPLFDWSFRSHYELGRGPPATGSQPFKPRDGPAAAVTA